MSMLDTKAKSMLVESMRKSLAKAVLNNKELTESAQTDAVNFIANGATYEQLLNLTMNPLRESKYLPDYVLEGAVAIVSEAMLSGRKVMGPNAIAQGGLNFQKKTGAIVTESMLDAAMELAQSKGLHVVAGCLKEAFAMNQKALEEAAKPVLSKKGAALVESVVTEAKKGEKVAKGAKKAAKGAKKAEAGVVTKAVNAVKGGLKKIANATGVSDIKQGVKEIGKASEAKSAIKTANANLAGKSKQALKNLGKPTVDMFKKNAVKRTADLAAAKKAARSAFAKGGAKVGATALAVYGAKKAVDKVRGKGKK